MLEGALNIPVAQQPSQNVRLLLLTTVGCAHHGVCLFSYSSEALSFQIMYMYLVVTNSKPHVQPPPNKTKQKRQGVKPVILALGRPA